MSVVTGQPHHGLYPELVGTRVLITGLEAGHGVDIARAFADHGARLVLQTPSMSPELEALLAVLAESAGEIRVTTESLADGEAAMRFAQRASQAYGGLDVVINLARIPVQELSADASVGEVEARVAAVLGAPTAITRVAANRMRLTWTEGLILNIVTQAPPRTTAEAALGSVTRATLAAMTRTEAQEWAAQAVRINAVGPSDRPHSGSIRDGLSSEPEIAALALHLASSRGRTLSGLVFDATGLPRD